MAIAQKTVEKMLNKQKEREASPAAQIEHDIEEHLKEIKRHQEEIQRLREMRDSIVEEPNNG